jgi:hypothetical protein
MIAAGATSLGEAATRFIGAPFRLHGFDPATGLDCVGLVVASLAVLGGHPVAPHGYGLRNLCIDQWLHFAERSGLVRARRAIGPDEVILARLGYGQHHLLITVGDGDVVHAHAGLRRVVRHRRDNTLGLSARWRVGVEGQG